MKTKRNYHMSMTPQPSGGWRCDYCGAQDPDCNNLYFYTECSYVYDVCEACGGDPNSNQCTEDCPAMMGLLEDPKLYVVGVLPRGAGKT